MIKLDPEAKIYPKCTSEYKNTKIKKKLCKKNLAIVIIAAMFYGQLEYAGAKINSVALQMAVAVRLNALFHVINAALPAPNPILAAAYKKTTGAGASNFAKNLLKHMTNAGYLWKPPTSLNNSNNRYVSWSRAARFETNDALSDGIHASFVIPENTEAGVHFADILTVAAGVSAARIRVAYHRAAKVSFAVAQGAPLNGEIPLPVPGGIINDDRVYVFINLSGLPISTGNAIRCNLNAIFDQNTRQLGALAGDPSANINKISFAKVAAVGEPKIKEKFSQKTLGATFLPLFGDHAAIHIASASAPQPVRIIAMEVRLHPRGEVSVSIYPI